MVQIVGYERKFAGVRLDATSGKAVADLTQMERAADGVVSALCPRLLQVRLQSA